MYLTVATGGSGVVYALLAVFLSSQAAAVDVQLYHIPYACSVIHQPTKELIGACSIFDHANVLVSVDNFNDTVKGTETPYVQVISEIEVHAGSNYMNPTILPRHKRPPTVQTRKALRLIVPSKFLKSNGGGTWHYESYPPGLSEQYGIAQDAFGVAFNIGFLELRENFTWSAYVRQMLIVGPNVQKNTKDELNRMLSPAYFAYDSCITYSWNRKLNRIRYYEVSHIPNDKCLDIYCSYQFSKCDQFPRKDYHVCYRSVKYVDVCPNARGAALFCNHFHHSVFAILTMAPTCGQRHVPAVYTTLPLVMTLYQAVYHRNYDFPPLYNLFNLDQKATDYDV